MSRAPSDTRPATNRATRVGIIFAPLGKLNVAALKYLIVHLNTLQHSIEFEILAADLSDPLLAPLRPGKLVDRSDCRKILPEFHARILMQFAKEQSDYDLVDQSLPEHFVVISLARFSDEHYGLKDKDIHMQALGNWEASNGSAINLRVHHYAVDAAERELSRAIRQQVRTSGDKRLPF